MNVPTQPFPLQNKVIFLQGAGRWPGPLLAKAFAEQGAIVAACDLSPIVLKPLEEITNVPGQIRIYVGDTARGMPARAIVDEVLSDFDHIDILVNNPRVAPNRPIIDLDEYDWQHTIDLNLNGPFLLTRLVARQMIEFGGGVILNLVSSHGLCGSGAGLGQAEPGFAAYAASQAGLLALSRTAAKELIAYNIHVYALCMEDTPSINASPRLPLGDLAVTLCTAQPAQPLNDIFYVASPQ